MRRVPGRWFPKSLAGKYTALTIVVGVCTMLAGAVLLARGQAREAYADQTRQGQYLARMLAVQSASALSTGDIAALGRLVQGLESYPEVDYVRVLDASGETVLLTALRRSPRGSPLKVVAPVALRGASPVTGTIELGMNWNVALEGVRELLRTLALLGVSFLTLAIAATAWLTRRVSSSIRRLVAAARAVAQGDLDTPVEVTGRDEVGELAATFSSMVQALRQSRDLLGEDQRLLETRVAEKTTELTARSEEARDLARRAEEGSRVKSRFLANMSHEIRTPMNGVLGMLQLLRETELNDTQRRFVRSAHASADGLLEVLNDILDYSKIEAGFLHLESIDMSLAEIVEETCDTFTPAAAGKGIQLACFVEPGTPETIQGDPHRVRQIVANLIGNAVKFTKKGEVTVRVNAAEDGPGSCRVFIEVEDTGIGIEPEVVAQLFSPFSQADGSTTRRFGGTGLGLAIVDELARRMGGRVDVRSELGHGTLFHVELPARLGKLGRREGQFDVLQGKTILVVDDNPTNCEIVLRYVGAWGMRAELAANGPWALEQLRAMAPGRIDVVVLDLHMDGMDGIDLVSTIRSTPGYERLPIICLSSTEIPREHRSHFDAVALKPIRSGELRRCLTSALSGRPVENETAPQPDRLEGGLGRHVLIVEDNPINQEVARAMLDGLGCSYEVKSNGREAVEAFRNGSFDVVLMDCMMPVMDGLEATREIRRIEAGLGRVPRTPVIALTAVVMPEDRERCLAAGMDRFLAKPVSCGALGDALRAVVSRRVFGVTAEAGPAAEELCVDPAALRVLAEGARDPVGLVRRAVGSFLSAGPARLVELGDAVAAGDAAKAHIVSHGFKASAAMFGAKRLSQVMLSIERASAQSELAESAGLLKEARIEFDAVCAELRKLQGVTIHEPA